MLDDAVVCLWYIDKSTLRHSGRCVTHSSQHRLAKSFSEPETGQEGRHQARVDRQRQEAGRREYSVRSVIWRDV